MSDTKIGGDHEELVTGSIVGSLASIGPDFHPVTFTASGSWGGWENGSVPSWAIANGANGAGEITLSSAYIAAPPDGTQFLFVNSGATVSQDLGTAAQPNTSYNLSVWVGRRLDMTSAGTNTTATIQLFVGTTPLCSASISSTAITAGTWVQQNLNCATGAAVPSGDLIISLYASGTQSDFDDISLTATPINAPHHATLTWADTVNPPGTTYNVYRASGGCPTTNALSLFASKVATLGTNPLTYVDSTVTQSQNYCYGVTAVYGGTESLLSVTTYVPQAPQGLTVQ
jgi:hypothetical protein